MINVGPLVFGIGGFILLLALAVLLRIGTGNKFEIKTSDIVLALIPIALWLFLTGQISELTFGDLRIVAAFKKASAASVEKEVTPLPLEKIRMDMKGGVSEIPDLLQRKTQALAFRLGHGGYYGPAIEEYFNALASLRSFKYVVLMNSDGTFFGLADGGQMAALARAKSDYARDFAAWLNESRTEQLSALPGFISAKEALALTSDTRSALQAMNALDVQSLPVLDEKNNLTGILDRSRLSASMLIEIAERLEQGSQSPAPVP